LFFVSTRYAHRVQDPLLAFLDHFHHHDRGTDDQHDYRDRDHNYAGRGGRRTVFVKRLFLRPVLMVAGVRGRGRCRVAAVRGRRRLLRGSVHLIQAPPQQHSTNRTPSDHLRHHDQVFGQRVAVDRHHARSSVSPQTLLSIVSAKIENC